MNVRYWQRLQQRPLRLTVVALMSAQPVGCGNNPETEAETASVLASGARACDVVIATNAPVRAVHSDVAMVRFHQTPKLLALSFAAWADEDLEHDVFAIEWLSPTSPQVAVVRTSCFDRLGIPVTAKLHLP
jgi:hypothetical protein